MAIKAYLSILILALPTLLAGCTSTDNITLDEVAGEAHFRDCWTNELRARPTCHLFTVVITNDNPDHDADTNSLLWEAQADNGGVYSLPRVVGANAIASGATGQVNLAFDLTQDYNARITEIRYQDLWMSDATHISVPTYPDADRF